MTPVAMIAILDRNIARHGQAVTLRRMSAGVTVELNCRAFVRDYRPDELIGGVVQGDTSVVISPSQLAGTAFENSPPVQNDKVVIGGRVRNIQLADPVVLDDQRVRINLQVRG